MKCKHFGDDPMDSRLKCAAFPNGIPEKYIENEPHNKVDPRQKNDIVFEPVDKWKDFYK